MAIAPVTYIRKPLYVDAVRITAANFEEVVSWCHGEVQQEEEGKKFIRVRVHSPKNATQTKTKAFIGDWVLYTERGYKVYTHKAFLASFDEVDSILPEIPLFYFDESNGWLTDQPPHADAEALHFEELMDIIKQEVSSEGRALRVEREAKLEKEQNEITPHEIIGELESIIRRLGNYGKNSEVPAAQSGRPSWTNGMD